MPKKSVFRDEKPKYVEAFIYPFNLMFRQPKVMLLGVLNWIPALVFTYVLYSFLLKYPILGQLFVEGMGNKDAMAKFMPLFVTALTDFLPFITFALLLGAFILLINSLAFTQIVIDRRTHEEHVEKISIGKALGTALANWIPMAGAYLWFILASFLLLAAFIVLFALGGALGRIGLIIIIPAAVGAIILMFVLLIASWIIEPVFLMEKMRGRACARAAFAFAWNNKLRGSLLMIAYSVAYIVLGGIAGKFGESPYFPVALSMLAGLPVYAWAHMVGPELYYELKKK
ncbi:MAG: hypothetical protein V1835_03500 [Candidatus Micrarchaeota archaeon]